MVCERTSMGLRVRHQHPIPAVYRGIKLEIGFRADLIVEELVIVEIKSEEIVPRVAFKILLTYLRLADKKLGLLINFREELLKDGIKRVVNRLPEPELRPAPEYLPSAASIPQ